ncbi:DUF6317 family protein [Actinoplanes sp. NPDC049681]|uniref:DUF6317 family protein n=1 Tax=Actinoplanes sp. NPDC049681 TaxID=3363905 RepID=UPI0037AD9459
MAAGFQVVYEDLGDMASAFMTESTQFAGLRPRMAPAPVDGGEATVNAGIAAVLSLFASLNAGISAAMEEHGTKLRECRDDYKENDADVVALYNKVIEEA